MDPTAFALSMDLRIPIIVFNVFAPHSIKRVVLGENLGTLVTA
jgi:uridylate kinase